MKPGDLLMYRDDKFCHHRFYEVRGVFLGGVGQESLVELASLTETPGTADASGRPVKTSLVPEPLLRGRTVYSKQEIE